MIYLRASDRTVLAAVAIFVSQVSNATGAAWSKSLFSTLGPEGVVALRLAFSALLLGVLTRAWRLRVRRDQLGNLVGYGLCLGLMNSVAYQAYARVPIGIAMAIEVTGPLALVILNSRRASDFAWLGCTVAGLALLLFPSSGIPALDVLGLCFAFGSATCWAGYIVFGKRVSTLGGGSIVAIGLAGVSLFTFPLGVISVGAPLFSPQSLALGLGIAILSSAFPFFLQMLALRQLSPKIFGFIASGVPAVGAAMSFIVLGEQLAARQWLGICLVVISAAGCTLAAARASAG
jgi:inner membrane transporter RhtA